MRRKQPKDLIPDPNHEEKEHPLLDPSMDLTARIDSIQDRLKLLRTKLGTLQHELEELEHELREQAAEKGSPGHQKIP